MRNGFDILQFSQKKFVIFLDIPFPYGWHQL
jgi:hypothetical protein